MFVDFFQQNNFKQKQRAFIYCIKTQKTAFNRNFPVKSRFPMYYQKDCLRKPGHFQPDVQSEERNRNPHHRADVLYLAGDKL